MKDLNLAFGCLQTKNWQEMLKILMPYVSKWNLLLPQSTRAVPNEVVSDFLSCFDIKAKDYGSDYQALLKENLNGGVLLVAGSMYMVGPLRALLVKEERALW
ncbi:MAG: hypothetical protein GYA55_12675 [SAR324 cluster bacterium]|uniref:Bifunctional folylpolyglutamate synthase/dihydrofolate synthase n=1 Tax=SAR324 cluster bacterium TaxID=2024889 RepID=A0A7X9FTG5_9DELT|nr:hypothetical protein [SAR324 cluster bacterium]